MGARLKVESMEQKLQASLKFSIWVRSEAFLCVGERSRLSKTWTVSYLSVTERFLD